MSDKLHALGSMVDGKTREYVKEALEVALAETKSLAEENERLNAKQETQLAEIRAHLAELENLMTSFSETEKYSLTKSKLIGFMKQNGWYD